MSAAPFRPSLARRLAAAGLRWAGALVVALAVVELGMRVLGLGVPPRGPNNDLPLRRAVPAREAPGLGEALRPGASGEVLYPGFAGVPDHSVRYEINSAGMRDHEYARPKPRGVYRVAVLGDSVTYGTGVDVADSLPKALERDLAKRHPDRTIEVMNCGVYAYNTSQEVAWLEYGVLPFEPDLVLFVATITDASGRNVPPHPERDYGWEVRWIERLGLTSGIWDPGDVDTRARALTMTLRRHSRLCDYAANKAYAFLFGRVKKRSYLLDWDPAGPGVAVVRRSLQRARRLADQHGFDLVVALYPVLTSLDDGYPFHGVAATLESICSPLEVPFVDLFPPLYGQEPSSLHAHAHDHHPNARAHRLVAAHLARSLEDLGFF